MRNASKILVEKPEGKRSLGRPSCRWEEKIKIDLQDIGYADVNWIHLVRDRVQRQACMNLIMIIRIP
jgi:hypothetical protein